MEHNIEKNSNSKNENETKIYTNITSELSSFAGLLSVFVSVTVVLLAFWITLGAYRTQPVFVFVSVCDSFALPYVKIGLVTFEFCACRYFECTLRLKRLRIVRRLWNFAQGPDLLELNDILYFIFVYE